MTYRELQNALMIERRNYTIPANTKLSGKGVTKAVLQELWDALQVKKAAPTLEINDADDLRGDIYFFAKNVREMLSGEFAEQYIQSELDQVDLESLEDTALILKGNLSDPGWSNSKIFTTVDSLITDQLARRKVKLNA